MLNKAAFPIERTRTTKNVKLAKNLSGVGQKWSLQPCIYARKGKNDSEDFPYLPLHDLVLRQAGGFGVHGHGVSASGGLVLDEAQAKRAATVLVSRELGDGGVGVVDSVETNNTSAARTSIGLILDLGLLNLADCGEELNEILVAGGPRQLELALVV